MSSQPLAAPHLTLEELHQRRQEFQGLIAEGEALLADPLATTDERADCQLMLAHLARAIAEVNAVIAQRAASDGQAASERGGLVDRS